MSVTTQHAVLGGKVITDASVTAAAVDNATGASGTLFYCEINNAANASQTVYVKWYDHADPDVGTTSPDIVFRVAGGETQYFNMPQGIAFGTAFSYACTQTGGTAGTASPSNAVIMRAIVS